MAGVRLDCISLLISMVAPGGLDVTLSVPEALVNAEKYRHLAGH